MVKESAYEVINSYSKEELFEITRSRARYIRFRCKETSVGEWNSITELSIYGQ